MGELLAVVHQAVPDKAFPHQPIGGFGQRLPQLLAGLAAPLLEGLDQVSWRWGGGGHGILTELSPCVPLRAINGEPAKGEAYPLGGLVSTISTCSAIAF